MPITSIQDPRTWLGLQNIARYTSGNIRMRVSAQVLFVFLLLGGRLHVEIFPCTCYFSPDRYIGEHISDAEADSREDDSYLFDLDNKVVYYVGHQ